MAKQKTDNQKSEDKLSKKLKDIIASIEKLTVVELADLVETLEEKFGVASLPAAAPAAAPASGQSPEKAEEKSIFNVVLTQTGPNRIQVIKAIRKLKPDVGLQDAKKMTEETPQELLKEVKKEEAEEAKKLLEEAGATVELK